MAANSVKQRQRGPGRRWQPGQSGNPHGRPRVEREIRELARTYGPEALAKLVTLMRSAGKPETQALAAQAILDRGYGRAPQGVEEIAAVEAATRELQRRNDLAEQALRIVHVQQAGGSLPALEHQPAETFEQTLRRLAEEPGEVSR